MPTKYRGTEQEVLALETIIKLSRSLNSLSAHLLPPLQKEFGVTESQLALLESLLHQGPLTQGQLCQKILRSGSNLTTVVDNLERDGLVRRERDPDDRRVQIVQLTPKGRELIERAFPRHVDRVTKAFGVLTDAEQRELGRLCRKLGRSLADQGVTERRERRSA
jgi:MarR family 2-MHQ and catechol resistance regulon transcriptional repressor